MNEITQYKMKFHAPLHIGARGVGYEETEDMIHSDTLFSALMTLWGHFYEDDIEAFCHNPPFIISSAFPFKDDTYFFPFPMVRIGKDEKTDNRGKKRLKRVRYVSQELLETILNGNGDSLDFDEKETFQHGKFWCKWDSSTSPDNRAAYLERELPRVNVDRNTNASDIFYFSEIFFAEDAGLFFLARFREREIKTKFETILRFLGDEGIGGDKRTGKGLFSLHVRDKFNISSPKRSDGFMTLSLYHPEETEFTGGVFQNASYKLITREGWLHTPGAMTLRRKKVRMAQEGSIFNLVGKDLYGTCPCVLDRADELGLNHNIYRYGIAFSVPITREK